MQPCIKNVWLETQNIIFYDFYPDDDESEHQFFTIFPVKKLK